ncbi:WXG100 family type VII secretion target [Saccharothrix sp. NRRL B-16348]|uniref:WXG100 family type VII secretion target n=1 Tax=Saccharothrix sp. NRRL B-16348 TaxID=1415542 RepID=UPI0006AE369D|nr:hypothetical protein [Saccharothrix sp. NRRL B-16348]
MNAPNPLVRKGEETAPTEGAGLFHDATEAVKTFSKGDWAEGLANTVGALGGVAQFLMDPIAGLLSAGFGWLIEHVDFLREPLDWLVGDQQTLDGMAKTWASVSDHLTETATDLGNAVKNDTAAWEGRDSDAYRAFSADRAATYGAVAESARGMSVLIMTCKTVLKVVRDIVRDLITEAVGKLISICLRWVPAVAAFGAGVAGAIAECVPMAVRFATKAIEMCQKLTRVFNKAGGLFNWLEGLLGRAQQALARRGDTFIDALKASQAADLKRVDDFVNRGATGIPVGTIARDAFGEAKQAIVDGLTGLPRDFPLKLGFEVVKEGAKVGDDGGWLTWQKLAAEEKSDEAEKRVDARRDEAERRAAAQRREEQGR